MCRNPAPKNSDRKLFRCAEAGFSLVEAIVAALISVVLAGVLLAIMRMNNDGVKNGAVNAKVQAQYETAMAEIAKYARNATAVVNAAAGEGFPLAAGLTATPPISKIEMYFQDAAGTVTQTRGFSVINGILMEWKPGWPAYSAFRVGNWSRLTVLDANPFTLSSNRKTLTVSMRVSGTVLGQTAVAPARGEVFTCRN
jgi:type II secretory pathway pseudopilin PulG